jgi:hypothetical protein
MRRLPLLIALVTRIPPTARYDSGLAELYGASSKPVQDYAEANFSFGDCPGNELVSAERINILGRNR